MDADEVEAAQVPVFLERAGLLPGRGLLTEPGPEGLRMTKTVFGQQAWLASRFEDVRTVLGDAELFTTGDSVPMFRNDDPDGYDLPGAILFTDPPEHTELRSMLTGSFTARAVDRVKPEIRGIVDQHLEAMASAGPPLDLVSNFSWSVPSLMICELLGIPATDRDALRRHVDASFDFTVADDVRATANAALNTYMAELVERMRADPGSDIFGTLIREHGNRLTTKNLVGIGATLFQAGHETTAHMIASSVLTLLRHPDQLALLRADRGRWGDAIEELLRYLAIVQINPPRRATRDTVVGGQAVARGDLLMVALPAANHDPARFRAPTDFDVTRKATGHLAFGHGIHHCLGAPLARAELTIALPALFDRFPRLALAIEDHEVVYKTGTVAHGVETLPVTW